MSQISHRSATVCSVDSRARFYTKPFVKNIFPPTFSFVGFLAFPMFLTSSIYRHKGRLAIS